MKIRKNHAQYWKKSGTNLSPIDLTAKVGIGTTSPRAKLHILNRLATPDDLGDFDNYQLVIQGENNSGNSAGILFSSSDDTYGGSAIVHYDAGAGGIGDLAFLTKQATTAVPPVEVMRLTSTGNVGIGTTSPNKNLHIAGNNATLRFEDDTPERYVDIVASDGRLILKADTNNTTATSYISTEIDGSEKMRITSAGNVGIGTTTPGTLLDLYSANGSDYNILQISNSSASAGSIYGINWQDKTNNKTYARITSSYGAGFTNSYLTLNVADSSENLQERLRIDKSGNVGIGTTAPQSKLDIYGDLRLSVASGGTNNIFSRQDSTGGAYRNLDIYGNNITFRTADSNESANSIARMFIANTSGNVGIGTTTPTARLHLKAGTATAGTAPLKLTSGVLNTAPEAGAIEFLTDKYYATITTGAARKEIQLYDEYYGEVYIYENSTSTGIATQNVYHAIGGAGIGTAGALAGFTVISGVNGAIASVADYSGTVAGTVKITVTAGHNLTTGDIITIAGTTDYNGTFSITSISSTEFYITETYTSSQTGIYIRGAALKASTGSAGTYRVSINITGFSAGANKTFKIEANKNLTALDNIATSRKFGTASDYSQMAASGLVTLADGDILWLSIVNQTDATDFTVRHLNANINRI